MKNIEITTSHNVTIEYKAAPLIYRIAATLIDWAIMTAAAFILILILGPLFQTALGRFFGWIIASPVILFYMPLWEIFNNGATPGKLALGIRVIKINSEPISIYDYVMRWVFRAVDISLSFGTLGMLTIISSPRNQRIGDYLADTTVVKVSRTDRISLNKILQLDALKDYEPVYRGVTALSEQDMLIIKEVADRYIQYPNPGHKKALDETILKLENILGIKAPPKKTEFLYTLIKDYVTLTR